MSVVMHSSFVGVFAIIRVGPKSTPPSFVVSSSKTDRFSNEFYCHSLSSAFAIRWSLKIPPHLRHFATLPCEILVSSWAHNLFKHFKARWRWVICTTSSALNDEFWAGLVGLWQYQLIYRGHIFCSQGRLSPNNQGTIPQRPLFPSLPHSPFSLHFPLQTITRSLSPLHSPPAVKRPLETS